MEIKKGIYMPDDLDVPEWKDFLDRVVAQTIEWTKEDKKPSCFSYLAKFRDYRGDITMAALSLLEKQMRIERINFVLGGWNGNHYYFVRGKF